MALTAHAARAGRFAAAERLEVLQTGWLGSCIEPLIAFRMSGRGGVRCPGVHPPVPLSGTVSELLRSPVSGSISVKTIPALVHSCTATADELTPTASRKASR
jgi:hypothetical protein